MRIPRAGVELVRSTSVAARVCVIGLACVVSGCASNQQHGDATYVGGPYASQIAQRRDAASMPPRHATAERRIEVEEDGKPAQEPGRTMRPEEDDPSQPWSPNYGRAAVPGAPLPQPRIQGPARVVDATLHDTDAGAAIVNASRRLNDREADLVMAKAISLHEMQRQ